MAFKIGDTVALKSGGPKMTVTHIGDDAMSGEPTVWVSWFDAKHTKQESNFPPDALQTA